MNDISDRPSHPGSATILIVEDEILMLRLLKKFFSRNGYAVLEASNGEQATQLYRNNKQQIDAVLLDMSLPQKTGREVFHALKEENAEVKVIMASGFLEPQIKRDMTLAGVRHFVSKPYELNDLLEIFKSVVKK
jgi:two-component system cell cycle sensor histidine kinase/response regulator CckA